MDAGVPMAPTIFALKGNRSPTRLMKQDTANTGNKRKQMVDQVYEMIRTMADGAKTLKIQDIKDRATTKGFKPDQLDKCLDEYEQLDVWQINQAKTKLTFIN